jgi:dTDP-4-amino-4,6-dideoxygalactose transaminase
MIPFIDLAAQQARIKPEIDAAIARVLASGQYILGPEVKQLEEQLAQFCGAKFAVTCSDGTDAMALCLMRLGVRPGDTVFVPSFTFVSTAEVVSWLGATPYFVDINPKTYNMCTDSLRAAITQCKQAGKLNPRGIIAVDLFGLPADFDAIDAVAKEFSLWLMMESAQGFGGAYKTRTTGSMGRFATTSFFPAKPLGCYGDGGAIFTNDESDVEMLHSLRMHGQGKERYDNVRIGMTGRLDTIQAAILIEKLKIFADEITARNKVAQRYTSALSDVLETPYIPEGYVSTWAQYTVAVPDGKRAELQAHLKAADIPTMIYYPKPLHLQEAYKKYPGAPGGLPNSDKRRAEVLSLPMHPYLMPDVQDRIINSVRKFFGKNSLAA